MLAVLQVQGSLAHAMSMLLVPVLKAGAAGVFCCLTLAASLRVQFSRLSWLSSG